MVTQSYNDFITALGTAQTVAVCGHTNPDGDCLGSVMALTLALRKKGFDAVPLFADEGRAPDAFAFLPFYDLLKHPSEYTETPDMFFAVDVPTDDRLAAAKGIFERAGKTFGIDHHPDTIDYADVTLSDPEASATGVLIWDLIREMDVAPDADIAMCCYVALVTDTGRFQYQNTDARTFVCASELCRFGADPASAARDIYQSRTFASLRLEALVLERMQFIHNGSVVCSWVNQADMEETGATKDDTEGLIDILRSIAGVRICIIFRENSDGIRGSMRAKGDEDVGTIARALGGGGHKAAAGFTYQGTLEEAISTVRQLLEKV